MFTIFSSIFLLSNLFLNVSGQVTCPPGWSRIGVQCYLFNEETKNQTDAQMDCVDKGKRVQETASLAIILSEREINLLTCHFSKYKNDIENIFWIGVIRDKANPTKLNASTLLDGTPITFSYWDLGEPDGPEQKCVVMYSGKSSYFPTGPPGLWHDYECDRNQTYLCQIIRPTELEPSDIRTSEKNCQPEWKRYQDSCYTVQVDNGTNYHQAARKCRDLPLDDALTTTSLTSIHKEQENEFLMCLLTLSGFDSAWIGLYKQSKDRLEWTDKSIVDYQKPLVKNQLQSNCIYLKAIQVNSLEKKPEWHGRNCRAKQTSICQYSLLDPNITETTTPVPKSVLLVESTRKFPWAIFLLFLLIVLLLLLCCLCFCIYLCMKNRHRNNYVGYNQYRSSYYPYYSRNVSGMLKKEIKVEKENPSLDIIKISHAAAN